MKNHLRSITLFFLIIFLTSCKTIVKEKELIKDIKGSNIEETNEAKSKLEVRYSCGEDGITEFINDGWIIVEEYSEEKVCSWKSYPATKDCNMDKDKGCKLIKPDIMGEEKVYFLEK